MADIAAFSFFFTLVAPSPQEGTERPRKCAKLDDGTPQTHAICKKGANTLFTFINDIKVL